MAEQGFLCRHIQFVFGFATRLLLCTSAEKSAREESGGKLVLEGRRPGTLGWKRFFYSCFTSDKWCLSSAFLFVLFFKILIRTEVRANWLYDKELFRKCFLKKDVPDTNENVRGRLKSS